MARGSYVCQLFLEIPANRARADTQRAGDFLRCGALGSEFPGSGWLFRLAGTWLMASGGKLGLSGHYPASLPDVVE